MQTFKKNCQLEKKFPWKYLLLITPWDGAFYKRFVSKCLFLGEGQQEDGDRISENDMRFLFW